MAFAMESDEANMAGLQEAMSMVDKVRASIESIRERQGAASQVRTKISELTAQVYAQYDDVLAKLENQEIENDDPPVFVVDTAFQLFFQRHLLFLYIQIDGFLCNTLSGKIIFQHTAKCTYQTKNYGNNPPV